MCYSDTIMDLVLGQRGELQVKRSAVDREMEVGVDTSTEHYCSTVRSGVPRGHRPDPTSVRLPPLPVLGPVDFGSVTGTVVPSSD